MKYVLIIGGGVIAVLVAIATHAPSQPPTTSKPSMSYIECEMMTLARLKDKYPAAYASSELTATAVENTCGSLRPREPVPVYIVPGKNG